MIDQVGIAVLGAGYWGRKLVSEYLAAERRGNAILLKVCDPSVAALDALLLTKETSAVGRARLTQKIMDVMDDPEISGVHIATPSPSHYKIAKMALERGKNVLVEKPMTLKPYESHELVDLARANNLVLKVGHIFRFNTALQVARRIIRLGELGRLFYVRVQWTDQASFPDRDIIFDLGPHPVDILNQLLGTWPLQVNGITRAYRGSGGEVAYLVAEFPCDIFAHIEMSWLHPNKVREVTVVGSSQTLVVDCLRQQVFRIGRETREEVVISANNTIESEINDFVESIVQRDTSSESGLIGAHTVDVLEKISRSMWARPLPVVLMPNLGGAMQPNSASSLEPSNAESPIGRVQLKHPGYRDVKMLTQRESPKILARERDDSDSQSYHRNLFR